MKYSITINKIYITKDEATLSVSGRITDDQISDGIFCKPKIVLYFDNGLENRRIPFVISDVQYRNNECDFSGTYKYNLDYIYWKTRNSFKNSKMYFNLYFGNYDFEKITYDINSANIECEDNWYNCKLLKDHIEFMPLRKKLYKNNLLNFILNDIKGIIFVLFALIGVVLYSIEGFLSYYGITKVAPGVKSKNPIYRLFKHVYKRLDSFFEKHNIRPGLVFIIFNVFNILLYITLRLIGNIAFTAEGIFRFIFRRKSKERNPLKYIKNHVQQRNLTALGVVITQFKKALIRFIYIILSKKKVHHNKITFFSARRNELSGNFSFVYNQIKNDKELDINFLYNTKTVPEYSISDIFHFCKAVSSSKVIVLDEFTPAIHYIDLKSQTKLIQLWHACGAFKTFGFSRLGKPKGSPQPTRNHRSYDYVTVSSTFCRQCHSEGFGISDEKIVPTGIPRTDVLFDEDYKKDIENKFYEKFPRFKGKKIILFAPTFRGYVKETAYYPVEEFNISNVLDSIGSEYAMIIKHHPFVNQVQPIPEKYKDFIIDLSCESELNDLLVVSDLIITDYSSLIFEASLLKKPMLFYTFDLDEYIQQRDFYFDLRLNAPGKIAFNLDQLISAIKNEDFETEKIPEFSEKFFDHSDGKSTERVVELIYNSLNK